MKKASFDHLNKLFEIIANEWNHQILLIDQNLLVVVREPKLYVLPILPHLVSKVLVSGEHHVLKDPPFYEVTHARDTKARQDRLDQRDKKRYKGMLRKNLNGNCPTFSSTICRPRRRNLLLNPLRRLQPRHLLLCPFQLLLQLHLHPQQALNQTRKLTHLS